MKVGIIYIRKSYVPPGKPDPASPAVQEKACRERCSALGLKPEIYIDAEGHLSGKTEDRPAWQRAKERLHDSDVGALVVYAWNRAFRNTRLLLSLVDELDTAVVRFVSVSHNLDTSTADGRMILTFLAAVDESEVTRASERRIATIDHLRREQGRHYGIAPFGTERIERGGDLVLAPSRRQQNDATDHDALAALFKLNAGGRSSFSQMAQSLNADGWRFRRRMGDLIPWRRERVRSILEQHWLYAGYVIIGRMRGEHEIIRGSHEPILPEALTKPAALRFSNNLPHRKRQPPAPYPLSGILRCKCGQFLRGTKDQRGRRKYKHTDVCELGLCIVLDADTYDVVVREHIARLHIPRLLVRKAQVEAMRLLAAEQSGRSVESERERISQGLERLKDLYVSGEIDRAEYDARKQQLQASLPSTAGSEIPAAAAASLEIFDSIRNSEPGQLQAVTKALYTEIMVLDREHHLEYHPREWCQVWAG